MGRNNSKPERERRRREAEERQAARDQRSVSDHIFVMRGRPGASIKEIGRLYRKLYA